VFDGRWTVNESSVGWPEINGVWWGGEDNAWLVADDETVGRWDGNAWVKVEGPNTGVNYLQKVWAESPNNVWIVAGGVDYPGAIAHWDGTAWTVPVHTGGGLRHMWAGSASNIWAAGDGGELQHYDGVSWSPVAHDAQGNLTGLWGYGNEVWATSSQGDLLHWDGSEMNVTHSLAQTLVSVGGSSPTDLWVASDRTVGRWDGSSWTWTPLPSSARAVFSLCVEEPGKPWVGTYGELLHLDTGGWVTSGADLPSFGSRPGRVFCQGPGAVRAILGAGGRWAVVRYDP
jgi:hypothetical protein